MTSAQSHLQQLNGNNQILTAMQRKTIRQLGSVLLVLGLLISLPPKSGYGQATVVVSTNTTEFEGKIYHLHTVEAQQTLYGISRAYGVTVESIMLSNPDARRGIRINQVLRIPAGGSLKPEGMTSKAAPNTGNVSDEFEYVYHVAGKNENFAYLANTFLVSEHSIREANPSRNEPFREGDYILIPVAKKEKRPPVTELQQLQRSNYDPYNTPTPGSKASAQQMNPPSKAQATASAKPVETILPFEIPQEQKANTEGLTASAQNVGSAAPTASVKAETPTNKNQHIVKPKETVFGIARQHQISPDELMKANPGIASSLKAGQVILIPEPIQKQHAAPLEPADSLFYHTVDKGQTLYSISRNYAVGIDELKKINPGLTENLKVGQKILIPKKKITQPYFIHQIEEGKRSRQLARDFNISAQEFYELNPSIGRRLYPDQKVKIPIETGFIKQPLPPGEALFVQATEIEKDTEVSVTKDEKTEIKSACESSPYNQQQTYRIALLLPLYLDEFEQLPPYNPANTTTKLRASSFLEFYNGFVMAADSLSKHFGLNLELLVFDVDQNAQKIKQTLADPRLKSVNLIIGPFFSQSFNQIASFAAQYKIPIVNPMSQRSEIIQDNPYVIKVKPGMQSLYAQVAKTIAAQYPYAKVFLYHANAYRHQQEVAALRSALDTYVPSSVTIDNASLSGFFKRNNAGRSNKGPGIRSEGNWFNIGQYDLLSYGSTEFNNQVVQLSYDVDNINTFVNQASAVRDNIVVVFSEDRVFAMEFVNKLNQVADTIPIKMIALPHWSRFDNLFIENLMRLEAHFSVPSLVDYQALNTEFFIHQYRKNYLSEPENFAFEGFDIGWYFLTALQKFGNDFKDCLPDHRQKLLQTSFVFEAPDSNSGLENNYWNIFKLSNYRQISIEN